MKKQIYKGKSRDVLMTELQELRAHLQSATIKVASGKNSGDYRTTRKNIARVLTELNSSKVALNSSEK